MTVLGDGPDTVGGVNDHTYSVSELTGDLEQLFNAAFAHEVWVQGEITGLKRTSAGHVYFDLVDAGPSVPARFPVCPSCCSSPPVTRSTRC